MEKLIRTRKSTKKIPLPPIGAFGCRRKDRGQRWGKEEEYPRKFGNIYRSGPIRKTSEEEPIEYSAHSGSLNEWSEPFNTDGTEDTEDGDAIMVGVVGVGGTLVPHGMGE